jgi:hypothetical protein
MSTLVVLASLFGAVLGQFFKVIILFPATALSILLIIAASEYGDDGPAWIALKIMALIPSISVGYVLGGTVFHIPDILQRLRAHRMHSATHPSSQHR